MTRIHLSAPDLRDLERDRVLAAIDSGWIAPAGPDLARFEANLADVTGRAHAVALTSGTAALHLALLGAGVGPGDDVIVSTLTFIGSVTPVVFCGATPVFLDSEPTSWNMDPALLDAELTERASRNDLPKAVVIVDLYGNPADYASLVEVCGRHDVTLIEDAAEGIGANHEDGPCGSFGESAIVSFNGNKIITSSGGGALVTDDAEAAERARYLSQQARQPVVHYEHTELGFNYRMSNILAALGDAQLERLPERIARRSKIHAAYTEIFARNDGIEVLQPPSWGSSNHWLTVVQVDPESAGTTALALMTALDGADIESRPVWNPMHRQPVFAKNPARLNGVSDRLFANGLCLPSGSGMTDAQLDRVLDALAKELR